VGGREGYSTTGCFDDGVCIYLLDRYYFLYFLGVEEEEKHFGGGRREGGREGRRMMWSVGKVFLLMLGEEGKEEEGRA